MTVVHIQELLYIGLSTDAKPASATKGSKFIEYDHDHVFLWDGTAWRELDEIVTDAAHQRVHNGEMWMVTALATDVADDASLDLVFTTPALDFHVTFQIAAEGSAIVFVYEDTVLDDPVGGSAAVVKNANRVTGDAGAPTALVGPTITGVGTLLFNQSLPGGTGGNASGGQGERRTEIVLAPSTNYLFRVTNKKGNQSTMSIALLPYENGD